MAFPSGQGAYGQNQPIPPPPCGGRDAWGSMHRISLLLAAGLLAMVPSASAIYVEGHEPPTWHDVTFEVRATGDGIEIVLAEGDFSQVQQGHHLNVTVVNAF